MSINRNVRLCVFLFLATNIPSLVCGQVLGRSQTSGFPVDLTSEGAPPIPSQIGTRIDETRLVRLNGNTHPNARADSDGGLVDPQLPMEHMILILKRSPEHEAVLTAFMARQLDPKSPDFHHWLKPAEFGRLYGPSEYDIAAVTNWLQNYGFSIDKVGKGRTFIEFSGYARLVQEAFHTEIHRYSVRGEEHIANSSDPSIPEALTHVVVGVLSLHNFFTKPMHQDLGSFHRVGNAGKWEPDNADVLLMPMFM